VALCSAARHRASYGLLPAGVVEVGSNIVVPAML
jgi:hypothetical protein